MIRKGKWKLIESFDPARVELYNLSDDLGEEENLADSHPDRRDELLSELEAWRVSVQAESMMPNPNFNAGAQ